MRGNYVSKGYESFDSGNTATSDKGYKGHFASLYTLSQSIKSCKYKEVNIENCLTVRYKIYDNNPMA